ncbi:germin-like protein [Trifolium medium]|uniref:Germin-like protein n=1 Tax=Trifolium medium TaxID=97028 RepID=A0A392N2Z6_9FABA|nr:germin-like protein [Trifolium medium]
MKMIQIIVFIFALISYTSNATSSAKDFCVANLLIPTTPSGFPCKPQSLVTANDFVFSGFVAGNTENRFRLGVTTASVQNLPGLNGLGISAARIDVGFNGTVPMHLHPDASEISIMVEGQMIVGFITPTSLFVKTINAGDVFVFPQGLLHFQVNSGSGTAVSFSAFTSSDPSMQVLDELLFGNSLQTATLQKTTLLDPQQIMKLKAVFGGSG